MTMQHYHVLLEWDSEASAWVTFVPTLNGLSTFGETKEEALANTREAILGYLEAAELEGIPLPGPAELVDLEVAVG
jgi:predicted RNase H-like HicB family nuclease